jgi:hypothetical protein
MAHHWIFICAEMVHLEKRLCYTLNPISINVCPRHYSAITKVGTISHLESFAEMGILLIKIALYTCARWLINGFITKLGRTAYVVQ